MYTEVEIKLSAIIINIVYLAYNAKKDTDTIIF